MFALMLQGSQANSREKFEHVIACVRNVREAWMQAARKPAFDEAVSPAGAHGRVEFANGPYTADTGSASHWNA